MAIEPTQSKRVRRCSLCRQAGHTKRRCPNDNESILRILQKKKQAANAVSVQVIDEHDEHSPHVLDLRQQEKSMWASIEMYKESKPVYAQASSRKTVRSKERIRPVVHPVGPSLIERGRRLYQQSLDRVNVFRGRLVAFPKQVQHTLRTHALGWQYFFRQLFSPRKQLAYVSLSLVFFLTIPFPAAAYYKSVQANHEEVVLASSHGFSSLQASTLALLQADLGGAQYGLTQALAAFSEAEDVLEQKNTALQGIASFIPILEKYVRTRKAVVQAGQYISLGNSYLLKGVNESMHGEVHLHPTDQLRTLEQHVKAALRQYHDAQYAIASIDATTLPDPYQDAFINFRVLFMAFVNDIEDVAQLIESIQLVLGSDDFKRYIVSFQNHRELRPSGGFMGSFAVLDVQKGRILDIHVPGGGWYDLRGQLDTYVIPPLPLQLVNGRWEAQDANWWADFPATAETIGWFYERSRGASIDGVIAINASVLEDVLKVIGDIQIDETGQVFEAENVLDALQEEVEVTADKIFDNPNPKAIIATLFDQLLNDLSSLDMLDLIQLLTVANTAAKEKNMQVYMKDAALQSHFQDFGWTGEMHETEEGQDYLFVVNSNLLGQKSDARIEQHIEHQAVVDKNGEVTVTMMITRTHTGEANERFYGAPNISYIRSYVPQGATLLAADGFTFPPEVLFKVPEDWYESTDTIGDYEGTGRLHEESGTSMHEAFGKTVFGNWMIVNPGERRTAYLVYRLPFSVFAHQASTSHLLDRIPASRYELYVQKQSGIESTFESTIIYPEGWKPIWRANDAIDFALNGATIDVTLNKDYFFGMVSQAEKKE